MYGLIPYCTVTCLKGTYQAVSYCTVLCPTVSNLIVASRTAYHLLHIQYTDIQHDMMYITTTNHKNNNTNHHNAFTHIV